MVGKCIVLYQSNLLTVLMRAVSWPGDGVLAPLLLVTLAFTLIYLRNKDKVFALVLVLATLFGEVVKYLLKNFYQIPRPGTFGCNVLTTYADKYSLPSGHTVFYTIFFGLLVYYSVKHIRELWAKLVFPVSLTLILLVGYSRIYLGTHWYLDVVVGYVIGAAILAVAILVYEYWVKKGKKNDSH